MSDKPKDVTELLQQFEKVGEFANGFRSHVRMLYGVYEWALQQQPVKAGDRARISDLYEVKERFADGHPNGYWPWRECLAPGAVGTVDRVEYQEHTATWIAIFVPDKQWTRSTDGKRIDAEPKYRFNIRVDRLVPLTEPTGVGIPCH